MVDIEQEIKNNFSFIRYCCNRFLKNEEEQELLFSNVLEIIWRRKNNFDGSNFKGWVRVVVKRCFIDEYRKDKYYF